MISARRSAVGPRGPLDHLGPHLLVAGAVRVAGRGHNGHAYRQMWRAIIYGPDFLVCQVERCIQPSRVIDRSIRGRVSAAPSLDMIVPFDRGGDPADLHNYRPAGRCAAVAA